ncbi:MAG: D-amino-acid transaminase [Magnetospirillum sp. WYHS-4]
MPRTAYVNGRYVPHGEAVVHIEDRGYQFADGVYEVIAVHGGRLVDTDGHLDRLDRSLREMRMAWPLGRRALGVVLSEVVRRNGFRDATLYLQVTRGVAPRDHAFPAHAGSSLVVTVRRRPPFDKAVQAKGVAVVTVPDIRWKRCDIKTISLIANVMAKQAAKEKGAYEAWLVDAEGRVTEGSSSNAWIVTKGGDLVTRHLDEGILGGITRAVLLRLMKEEGIRFAERPFTMAEAKVAREAFATGSTTLVKPIVSLDGKKVGDGKPGPVALRLLDLYVEHMEGRLP